VRSILGDLIVLSNSGLSIVFFLFW